MTSDINIEGKLSGIIPEQNIIRNENMSRHTTFRIGGPADYFIRVDTLSQLRETIRVLHDEGAELIKDYYVVGNGSNLLVSDKGFRGIILTLSGDFEKIELVDNTHIKAGSGAMNAQVANLARDNALTGFEFAHGIPGTIGGALIMNAGAYGGEMKQVVSEVTYMDENADIKTCTCEEAGFGYRDSAFKRMKCILLSTVIALEEGEKSEIEGKMKDLMDRRRQKQPLEFPSAGSTFKRPEGYFAGKLIEDAGLRGFKVGGAEVSMKHCGFVINSENATADDVDRLIKEVQKRVLDNSGVELVPEVIRLGEF